VFWLLLSIALGVGLGYAYLKSWHPYDLYWVQAFLNRSVVVSIGAFSVAAVVFSVWWRLALLRNKPRLSSGNSGLQNGRYHCRDIDAVVASRGDIVQPIGADAPKPTAGFRDGGNIIGPNQEPG